MAEKLRIDMEFNTRLDQRSFHRTLADIDRQLKPKEMVVQLNGKRMLPVSHDIDKALISNQKNAVKMGSALDKLSTDIARYFVRFSAFTLAASTIFAGLRNIQSAQRAAIDFDSSLIKVAQVLGTTRKNLKGLNDEVFRLSTGIGVNSKDLFETSVVLAQTGLSATETKKALESLAQTSLTPNFGSMKDTTQGFIAIMNQFKLSVDDTSRALSSINAVASKFPVESQDIIEAVRKAGGVFALAGGKIEDFIGLFTAIRSTTRESAETIGVGIKTIITRIQDVSTTNLLSKLGIEGLRDEVTGELNPINEVFENLAKGVKRFKPTSAEFAEIVKALGGRRQASRVIPLLVEYGKALEATGVALRGSNSLSEQTGIAQDALATQFAKVRAEFEQLLSALTQDSAFRDFLTLTLRIITTLTKLASTLKPILPLFAVLGVAKLIKPAVSIGRGLSKDITPLFRARGGHIPGNGFKDDVPALLTKGEYVLNKDAVKRVGLSTLDAVNAGRIAKFNKGGVAGYASYAEGSLGGVDPKDIKQGLDTLSTTIANIRKELSLLGKVKPPSLDGLTKQLGLQKELNDALFKQAQLQKTLQQTDKSPANTAKDQFKQQESAGRTVSTGTQNAQNLLQSTDEKEALRGQRLLDPNAKFKRTSTESGLSQAKVADKFQKSIGTQTFNVATTQKYNDRVKELTKKYQDEIRSKDKSISLQQANAQAMSRATAQAIRETNFKERPNNLGRIGGFIGRTRTGIRNAILGPKQELSKEERSTQRRQNIRNVAFGSLVAVNSQFGQDTLKNQLGDKLTAQTTGAVNFGVSSGLAASTFTKSGTGIALASLGGAIFGAIQATKQFEKEMSQQAVSKALDEIAKSAKVTSEQLTTLSDTTNKESQRIQKETTSASGSLFTAVGEHFKQLGTTITTSQASHNPLKEGNSFIMEVLGSAFGFNNKTAQETVKRQRAAEDKQVAEFNKPIAAGLETKFKGALESGNIDEARKLFIPLQNAIDKADDGILNNTVAIEKELTSRIELAAIVETAGTQLLYFTSASSKAIESQLQFKKVLDNIASTPVRTLDSASSFVNQRQGIKQFGSKEFARDLSTLAGVGGQEKEQLQEANRLFPLIKKVLGSGTFEGADFKRDLLKELTTQLKFQGGASDAFIEKISATIKTDKAFKDQATFQQTLLDLDGAANQVVSSFDPLRKSVEELANSTGEAASRLLAQVEESTQRQFKLADTRGSVRSSQQELLKTKARFAGTSVRPGFDNDNIRKNVFESTGADSVSGLATIISNLDRAAKVTGDGRFAAKANAATEALKKLADSGSRTGDIIGRLGELQAGRESGRGFTRSVLFADDAERQKLVASRRAASLFAGSGADIKTFGTEFQKKIIEGLEGFGSAEVGKTGKTGTQLASEALDKLGGTGISAEETALQSKVITIQQESINASQVLADREQQIFNDFIVKLDVTNQKFLSSYSGIVSGSGGGSGGTSGSGSGGGLGGSSSASLPPLSSRELENTLGFGGDKPVAKGQFLPSQKLTNFVGADVTREGGNPFDLRSIKKTIDTPSGRGFFAQDFFDDLDRQLQEAETNAALGIVPDVASKLGVSPLLRSEIFDTIPSDDRDKTSGSLLEVQNYLKQLVDQDGSTTDSELLRRVQEEIEQKRREFGSNRFAIGGIVGGSGSGDTVPAMLTPGEGVVTVGGMRSLGANGLHRLNRGGRLGFANGGVVPSIVNMEGMDALNSFNSNFGMNIERLTKSLEGIPSNISMTVTQTVNVIHNGAQWFANLEPSLQKLAEETVKDGINKMLKNKFPNVGTI